MLLAPVRAFARKHSLFASKQRLIIGVSGGPDSLVLLHLLTRLRAEFELDLHVAHLHHGLRPEADDDAGFVMEIAKAWDVPCTVERAGVAALAKEKHLSVEEAGRLARYSFFARLGSTAAVAHNADDQAETVLMHLLRGSGLSGLRGMLPKASNQWAVNSEQVIVRPLLGTTRAEIEAYAAAHDLKPRLDSTNADRKYYRNRLRHELLPLLETYNPNIRQVLRRTAEVAAGDYELVCGLVEQVWADTLLPSPGPTVTFDLARWRALSLPLQRALLREAINRLRPGLRDVDFTPIENAIAWAQTAESGHTADLLGGLCLKIVGPTLIVGEWQRRLEIGGLDASRGDYEVPLAIPGVTRFLDWQFTTEIVAASNPVPDRWTAFLPLPQLPDYPTTRPFDHLTIRARRPGDRFQPLGMNGHSMKLSDFMINQKIPVTERDRWPLLVSGETVLWVCGHRVSELVRAEANRWLRVTAIRQT
ncbi:MAG: tRNA lysidine(34) synthetase TilS [Chloroflexi bacterium]|nr:tRNA lysidine(34) synthetase TilS [Chloroflexota bacterium]